MSSEKTMMLITSDWNKKPSFRMIPVSTECPYNEVIFDPETKTLAIVSKEKKDSFQMLPKLDVNGDLNFLKRVPTSGRKVAEERKMIETYYEYYISVESEMKEFIYHFGRNAVSFDFKAFFEAV